MFKTMFNWLPERVGMGASPDEFRADCYRHSSELRDESRWGGNVDACQISGGVYNLAWMAVAIIGLASELVGGYIALSYVRNDILGDSETHENKPGLSS